MESELILESVKVISQMDIKEHILSIVEEMGQSREWIRASCILEK